MTNDRDYFTNRLSKMDDVDNIKKWVIEEITQAKISLKTLINNQIALVLGELKKVVNNNLLIPNLLGENCKFQDLREFIQHILSEFKDMKETVPTECKQ